MNTFKSKCLKCDSTFTGRLHLIGHCSSYYKKAGIKSLAPIQVHLCIHCYIDIFKLNWKLRKWFWKNKERRLFDSRNTQQEYLHLASIEIQLWKFFLSIQKDTLKRTVIFYNFLDFYKKNQEELEKLKAQYTTITESSTLVLPGMH